MERDDRVSADYIEIFFRDQYLGRPDMWRLSSSLAGQCLHLEQRVRFVGAIEAVIKTLYRRGKPVGPPNYPLSIFLSCHRSNLLLFRQILRSSIAPSPRIAQFSFKFVKNCGTLLKMGSGTTKRSSTLSFRLYSITGRGSERCTL